MSVGNWVQAVGAAIVVGTALYARATGQVIYPSWSIALPVFAGLVLFVIGAFINRAHFASRARQLREEQRIMDEVDQQFERLRRESSPFPHQPR